MKNKYSITDMSGIGLPFIEVHGNEFHHSDLYEFVGRQQFMTIFNFKEGTACRIRYGECVTGVIYYDHKTVEKLSQKSQEDIDFSVVKIESPFKEIESYLNTFWNLQN